MKNPLIIRQCKFSLWSKYSKSPAAQAYREIINDGFFQADYLFGTGKEVYAFDLSNGVFLYCQAEPNKYSGRLVTLVEYEFYSGFRVATDGNHSFVLEWFFHLASLPLLRAKRDRFYYKPTEEFVTMLNARNQGVINATRKPGYTQWREKMKQKGWLIDREVDNQIMAQRRREQVLEIVPLEELEGTSNMQGR